MCAMRSWFWGGTTVGDAALPAPYGAPYSDDMFTDVLNALLNYDRRKHGVIFSGDPRYSGNFLADTSGVNSVTIQPGIALVDGKLFWSDATETYNFTAGGTWYHIVLRKDFNAQTVRMVFRPLAGLTQTDGSIWEIEIWRFYYEGSFMGSFTSRFDYRNFVFTQDRVLLARLNFSNEYADNSGPINLNLSTTSTNAPFAKYRIEYSDLWASDPNIPSNLPSVDLNIAFTSGPSAINSQSWYLTGSTQTITSGTFPFAGVAGANAYRGAGWIEVIPVFNGGRVIYEFSSRAAGASPTPRARHGWGEATGTAEFSGFTINPNGYTNLFGSGVIELYGIPGQQK